MDARTILLADDSRFLRLANERALQKVGYQVLVACDGEDALRLAVEGKPDLIILDMMLPKISGLDVLRALRKDPATAAIPVMVLSSLPQTNRDKIVNEGAAAYFQKSMLHLDKDPDQFLNAVLEVMKRNEKLRKNTGSAHQKTCTTTTLGATGQYEK